MSHLDIREQTADRLVINWHRPTNDKVATGIVAVAMLGFLGFGVVLYLQTWDWLLLGGLVLGIGLFGRMALLPSRITLDKPGNRISVSRPLYWRWRKLSDNPARIEVDASGGDHVGRLMIGPWELARTEALPTADAARHALEPELELVATFLPTRT